MWRPGKGRVVAGYIADPRTRHNARASLIDGALFSVMVGLTMPFMGVYAIQLGASDFVVGLLTSIPALVATISQLPSAAIVNRYATRLRVTLRYSMVHRLFYLLMAFLAFLPQDLPGRAVLLVIVFSMAQFPATVAGVGWTTLMGELFPSQLRGRVFGERNMLLGLVSLLATAAAGPFLDWAGFPVNYFVLFAVSFVCLMASWLYLMRLQEGTPVPERCQDSRWRPQTMTRVVREILRDPEFGGFTAAAFVFHLGLQLPVALFTLLFVNELDLSTSWIGAFAVIWGLFSALTFRRWGRLADARGSRYALALSMLVLVPLPIFYGLVQSPWPIALLMAIGGVAGAGFGLALFNGLLDCSPAGNREDYVAVFNTLMSLTGFLMPVIGVALYQRWGFLTVFILAALIRVVGTWMLFRAARRGAPLSGDRRAEERVGVPSLPPGGDLPVGRPGALGAEG